MDRRELLIGAAAMAVTAAANNVFAAEHDHMSMGMSHDHKSTRNEKLIAVAADCVLKANVCLQHCIVLMGQGEKDLAACARSSSEVASISTALQQLASAETKQLPQLAKVAMEILKNCEDECKKQDKHSECKACGEACVTCYNECKFIAV